MITIILYFYTLLKNHYTKLADTYIHFNKPITALAFYVASPARYLKLLLKNTGIFRRNSYASPLKTLSAAIAVLTRLRENIRQILGWCWRTAMGTVLT